MRKLLPSVAVAALAVTGGFATLGLGTGVAGAHKAPVAATCTGGYGSTTATGYTSGVTSLVTGCSSTSTKVTANGVNVSSLSSATAGTGEIFWTGGKNTTYTVAITADATNGCTATYLGQTASFEEAEAYSSVAGTGKVNADGSGSVCVYYNSSDGTVYEANFGSTTF